MPPKLKYLLLLMPCNPFLRLLAILVALSSPLMGAAQNPKSTKVEAMVVGSDHLGQLYNKQPESDVFSPKKQAELAKVRAQLARFRPDIILVEAEPKEQPQIDSLYALYQKGALRLEDLPFGRGEQYQIGFALARQLGLPSPKGVNYFTSTSQSLLNSGTNIEAYTRDLRLLQTTSRPLRASVQKDSLSLYDYLALANQPELIGLLHRMQFNTPAQVMNGSFAAGGTNTVDLGAVDTEYIGAHFITLFYNRNLKIYSNILRAQRQTQARRVLLLFGLAHVGVLEELLAVNPDYEVVHAAKYLKTSKTKLLRLNEKGRR